MADRTPDTAERKALDDLLEALHAVGLQAQCVAREITPLQPERFDAEVQIEGGIVPVELKVRSTPTPAEVADWPDPPGDALPILVADRVTGAVRRILRDRGWGWLDRRGHLRLWWPGVRVDTDITPLVLGDVAPRRPVADLSSPVATELALAILMEPTWARSARALARDLGRSTSHVANLLAVWRAEGLVRDDGAPVIPDLFWALAEVWRPRWYLLRGLPGENDQSYEQSWWVLSGTLAAASLGVGLVTDAGYPPEFYVPDERVVRRLVQHFGEATNAEQRAAAVAVGPAPQVCKIPAGYADVDGLSWRRAHPVVVALDLAQDRARGHEVLDGWDAPAEAGHRVW